MRLWLTLPVLLLLGVARADGPRSWTFDTQSTKGLSSAETDQQQILTEELETWPYWETTVTRP